MRQINIHQAKTHLSRLVDEAVAGESFIIAKAGKPLVKVVALSHEDHPSPLGFMAGEFEVPEDFDSMMQDEIVAMFQGNDLVDNDVPENDDSKGA